MPWGRLDDSLYDHPKLDELGAQRLPGVGLWAVAISWCNRRLTDGFIPAGRIRQLGGTSKLAERLADAGLFDRVEDGYLVHDFLEFNDSRAETEAKREQRREAGRRGGRARSGSISESPSESSSASASPRPVPSRPVENPEPGPAAMRAPDPADVYWTLTGRYPNDKPLAWIDDLTSKYGVESTIKAIAQAHSANRNPSTLLGRASDLLKAEARALDLKAQVAERDRLAAKRAEPRVVPDRDAVNAELRRLMGLDAA